MTDYIAQLKMAGPWYPIISFNGLWLTLCTEESRPDNTFEEYLIDVVQIRQKSDIKKKNSKK